MDFFPLQKKMATTFLSGLLRDTWFDDDGGWLHSHNEGSLMVDIREEPNKTRGSLWPDLPRELAICNIATWLQNSRLRTCAIFPSPSPFFRHFPSRISILGLPAIIHRANLADAVAIFIFFHLKHTLQIESFSYEILRVGYPSTFEKNT